MINSVAMNPVPENVSPLSGQNRQAKVGANGLTSQQKQDFAEVLSQAILKSVEDSGGRSIYGSSYGNNLPGSLYGLYSGYGNSLLGNLYGLYNGSYGNSLLGSLYGLYGGSYGGSLLGSLYGLYGNALYGYNPYGNYSVMNQLFSGKSSMNTGSSVPDISQSDASQTRQAHKNQIESKLRNSSAALLYQKHMAMMNNRTKNTV